MRWKTRYLPILALVAGNVVLGGVLAPHFGQNTDEWAEARFGELSLRAYREPLQGYRGPVLEAKGPFYFMIWAAAATILDEAVPAWSMVEARHMVNFLVFQGAIVAVYLLSLRVARPAVAFAAALLFESQPLLFGHAFINQKDSTFMAFFAVAMVLGLSGVDSFLRSMDLSRSPAPASESFGSIQIKRWPGLWRGLRLPLRRWTVMSVFLACGAIAVRVLLDEVLKGWIAGVVTAALNGTAWPPLNSLFLRLAENSALTPASAYVAKGLAWLDIAVATLVAAMLVLALWVARPLLGETSRRFFRDVFQGHAGPAAVILGMAVAIRTAGIFGGVLVVGYAWHRWRRRSAPFLLTYSLGAAVVAFALWPQLWGGPLDFLRSSVERSLQFPDGHEVLFRGEILVSNGLPSIFLPWLMAIQFTFPGVLLVLLALPVTVWIALRPAQPGAQLWVLLLWFFLPSLAVVILNLSTTTSAISVHRSPAVCPGRRRSGEVPSGEPLDRLALSNPDAGHDPSRGRRHRPSPPV
jgi:hypothetical protein